MYSVQYRLDDEIRNYAYSTTSQRQKKSNFHPKNNLFVYEWLVQIGPTASRCDNKTFVFFVDPTILPAPKLIVIHQAFISFALSHISTLLCPYYECQRKLYFFLSFFCIQRLTCLSSSTVMSKGDAVIQSIRIVHHKQHEVLS